MTGRPGWSLQPLSNVTRHGADLQWSANGDLDFARFKMAGNWGREFSRSDQLVATITDPAPAHLQRLLFGAGARLYYYCVYAVDTQGMYSCPSNEGMAHAVGRCRP